MLRPYLPPPAADREVMSLPGGSANLTVYPINCTDFAYTMTLIEQIGFFGQPSPQLETQTVSFF